MYCNPVPFFKEDSRVAVVFEGFYNGYSGDLGKPITLPVTLNDGRYYFDGAMGDLVYSEESLCVVSGNLGYIDVNPGGDIYRIRTVGDTQLRVDIERGGPFTPNIGRHPGFSTYCLPQEAKPDGKGSFYFTTREDVDPPILYACAMIRQPVYADDACTGSADTTYSRTGIPLGYVYILIKVAADPVGLGSVTPPTLGSAPYKAFPRTLFDDGPPDAPCCTRITVAELSGIVGSGNEHIVDEFIENGFVLIRPDEYKDDENSTEDGTEVELLPPVLYVKHRVVVGEVVRLLYSSNDSTLAFSAASVQLGDIVSLEQCTVGDTDSSEPALAIAGDIHMDKLPGIVADKHNCIFNTYISKAENPAEQLALNVAGGAVVWQRAAQPLARERFVKLGACILDYVTRTTIGGADFSLLETSFDYLEGEERRADSLLGSGQYIYISWSPIEPSLHKAYPAKTVYILTDAEAPITFAYDCYASISDIVGYASEPREYAAVQQRTMQGIWGKTYGKQSSGINYSQIVGTPFMHLCDDKCHSVGTVTSLSTYADMNRLPYERTTESDSVDYSSTDIDSPSGASSIRFGYGVYTDGEVLGTRYGNKIEHRNVEYPQISGKAPEDPSNYLEFYWKPTIRPLDRNNRQPVGLTITGLKVYNSSGGSSFKVPYIETSKIKLRYQDSPDSAIEEEETEQQSIGDTDVPLVEPLSIWPTLEPDLIKSLNSANYIYQIIYAGSSGSSGNSTWIELFSNGSGLDFETQPVTCPIRRYRLFPGNTQSVVFGASLSCSGTSTYSWEGERDDTTGIGPFSSERRSLTNGANFSLSVCNNAGGSIDAIVRTERKAVKYVGEDGEEVTRNFLLYSRDLSFKIQVGITASEYPIIISKTRTDGRGDGIGDNENSTTEWTITNPAADPAEFGNTYTNPSNIGSVIRPVVDDEFAFYLYADSTTTWTIPDDPNERPTKSITWSGKVCRKYKTIKKVAKLNEAVFTRHYSISDADYENESYEYEYSYPDIWDLADFENEYSEFSLGEGSSVRIPYTNYDGNNNGITYPATEFKNISTSEFLDILGLSVQSENEEALILAIDAEIAHATEAFDKVSKRFINSSDVFNQYIEGMHRRVAIATTPSTGVDSDTNVRASYGANFQVYGNAPQGIDILQLEEHADSPQYVSLTISCNGVHSSADNIIARRYNPDPD